MDIGIFSRTYAAMDVDVVFAQVQRDGMSHVQFNFSSAGLDPLPASVTEAKLEEIRQAAQRHAVTMDALTGTFNMIDPDLNAREQGIQQFALQCRLAQALEIPVVTLCTGSKNPRSKWVWDDRNREEASWADLLRTTERILPMAEQSGRILAFEPEASNIINTAERAEKYLDTYQSPHLKVIMDGANLMRPGEVDDLQAEIEGAVRLLAEHIVLAHAKDYIYNEHEGSLRFCGAGIGMMDWPHYVHTLQSAGYNGPLIMHGLEEADAADCRAGLERCL